MKKKPLPIGISDFRALIEGGYYYIDKSLFIEEIWEKGTHVALIPRPRRFGKTLNVSMLRYFFEKSSQKTSHLFEELAIWQHPFYREKQGKYPVIFLTFKDNKHTNWAATQEHFQILLAEEFQRHRYLLESKALAAEEKEDFQKILQKKGSPTLYEHSLRLLTKWLFLHHNTKVLILIDEYDTPAHAAYTGGFYRELIHFLRNFLSGGLKDNAHLEKGVLTGILRIAKESIFSGMNNVSTFSPLQEEFQSRFGLVEEEVQSLLNYYELQHHLPNISRWYDGYCIGKAQKIYNPWSVLHCCFKQGALLPYWVNSSDNTLMQECITRGNSESKIDLEKLLQGNSIDKSLLDGSVFPDLQDNPDALWTLLLYSGYLTLDPSEGSRTHRLRIPNEEVRLLYQSTIQNWFLKTLQDAKYRLLLQSLTEGAIETFGEILQEFVLTSASIFDVSRDAPEKVYHAFILGMLVGLQGRYDIRSNRESGLGRYDVLLLPKDRTELGIVLEFKKIPSLKKMTPSHALELALQQIVEKQYSRELQECGVQNILHIAIAFEGKQLWVASKKG